MFALAKTFELDKCLKPESTLVHIGKQRRECTERIRIQDLFSCAVEGRWQLAAVDVP